MASTAGATPDRAIDHNGPFTDLTVSIGGHMRTIATFPRLRCADPFVDE